VWSWQQTGQWRQILDLYRRVSVYGHRHQPSYYLAYHPLERCLTIVLLHILTLFNATADDFTGDPYSRNRNHVKTKGKKNTKYSWPDVHDFTAFECDSRSHSICRPTHTINMPKSCAVHKRLDFNYEKMQEGRAKLQSPIRFDKNIKSKDMSENILKFISETKYEHQKTRTHTLDRNAEADMCQPRRYNPCNWAVLDGIEKNHKRPNSWEAEAETRSTAQVEILKMRLKTLLKIQLEERPLLWNYWCMRT